MQDPVQQVQDPVQQVTLKNGVQAVLRPAREEDAAQLVELAQAVVSEAQWHPVTRLDVTVDQERALIREYHEAGDLFLVAESDNALIGYAMLRRGRWDSTRHVGTITMSVKEGFRDIGLGSAMTEYVLRAAERRGLERLELGVLASNVRATALYKKFGFIVEGIKRDAFKLNGQYVGDVMMALFLRPGRPGRPEAEQPPAPSGF